MGKIVGALGQLIFAGVGGWIGGAIGGPKGARFGAAIGNLVGSMIFGDRGETPSTRLTDLEVESSDYGEFIKEFYGRMQTAGSIFDCRYIVNSAGESVPAGIEEVKSNGGGGGVTGAKPSQPASYSYYLTAAYLWGKGPLDIEKLWWEDTRGKRLIYNAAGATDAEKGYILTPEYDINGDVTSLLSDGLRIYRGLWTQPVDSVLQGYHPDGVPAYRPLAYTILHRFPLTHGEGSLTALVYNEIKGRRDIITHRLGQAGVPLSRIEIDVIPNTEIGAVVSQQEGAKVLCERVATFSLCNLSPVNGLIEGRSRINPIVWRVDEEELGAVEIEGFANDVEAPNALPYQSVNERDLPSCLIVEFQDPARNYEKNSVRAFRETAGHRKEVTVSLPFACTFQTASDFAMVALDEMWAALMSYESSLLPKHLRIAPGDVIETVLEAGTSEEQLHRFLVQNQSITPNLMITCAGDRYDPAVYGQHKLVPVDPLPPPEVVIYAPPQHVIVDSVALFQDMADSAGFLIGAAVADDELWEGAQLQSDPDTAYGNIDMPLKSVIGSCVEAYSYEQDDIYSHDYDTVLTIELVMGTLLPCSESDCNTKGANTLCLGQIVLQFTEATQTGANTFEISGILPGLFGSDYLKGVAAGEKVLVLTNELGEMYPGIIHQTVPLTKIGVECDYRVVSMGIGANNDGEHQFTVEGNSLKPLSPFMVTLVERNDDGVTISWEPRTRYQYGSDWPIVEQSDPNNWEILLAEATNPIPITITDATQVTIDNAEIEERLGFVPDALGGTIAGVNGLVGKGFERTFEGL